MESCLFVIWENIRIIFYVIDFGLTAFLIKLKLRGHAYLEVKHRWKSKVTMTQWPLIKHIPCNCNVRISILKNLNQKIKKKVDLK